MWSVAPKTSESQLPPLNLSIHHLTLDTAEKLSGLVDYLYTEFADEVHRGQTYPQETCSSREVFEAYFFAADVFVAVLGESRVSEDSAVVEDGKVIQTGIEEMRKGREWKDCLVGFFYVSESSTACPTSIKY